MPGPPLFSCPSSCFVQATASRNLTEILPNLLYHFVQKVVLQRVFVLIVFIKAAAATVRPPLADRMTSSE